MTFEGRFDPPLVSSLLAMQAPSRRSNRIILITKLEVVLRYALWDHIV